jgi:hypothetical protein
MSCLDIRNILIRDFFGQGRRVSIYYPSSLPDLDLFVSGSLVILLP